MKKSMELAQTPHLATAEIRNRISDQANKADRLHDAAVFRTNLFQYAGLLIIAIGLGVVVAGAFLVYFRGMANEKLVAVSPVVGVVFNVVGGGLIAFHRAAARTALQYYDRKQGLDNVLTALELSTSNVMQPKAVELMDSLIRTLFPAARPNVPLDEADLKKK